MIELIINSMSAVWVLWAGLCCLILWLMAYVLYGGEFVLMNVGGQSNAHLTSIWHSSPMLIHCVSRINGHSRSEIASKETEAMVSIVAAVTITFNILSHIIHTRVYINKILASNYIHRSLVITEAIYQYPESYILTLAYCGSCEGSWYGCWGCGCWYWLGCGGAYGSEWGLW